MRTYKVKGKWVFEGTIDVKAESKEKAKEIVEKGFNHPVIDIGSTSSWDSDGEHEGIVDWNVGLMATKETFK